MYIRHNFDINKFFFFYKITEYQYYYKDFVHGFFKENTSFFY